MEDKSQESQNKMLTIFEEHFDTKNEFGLKSYMEAFTPVEYYKNITSYQKRAIKFLLNNFAEKRGCILDQEKEMNVFIEVVTFFKCVTDSESLFGIVLSSEEQIATWKLYFSKLSNISVNALNNREEIKTCNWSKFNITLVNFKLIQFLPVKICKVLILDCADEIINTTLRTFSQNLCCEMRIALTNARIRRVSQRKVLWELMKFTNPQEMMNYTLKSFLSECACNIENLLWFQWSEMYLRLDWKSYKKCEKSINISDQDSLINIQSTPNEPIESNDSSELNLKRKSEFSKSSVNEIKKSKFKDGSTYFRYFNNEFYTPNCYSLQQRKAQQEITVEK